MSTKKKAADEEKDTTNTSSSTLTRFSRRLVGRSRFTPLNYVADDG
jgi:hypothetical protein